MQYFKWGKTEILTHIKELEIGCYMKQQEVLLIKSFCKLNASTLSISCLLNF